MIKLGVIGGGINSAVGRAHVAALRMTGKFHLVGGVFSGHQHTDAESAAAYGVDSCSDIARLFPRCDRVVVLSPTPLHYGHVMQCIDAGIPVLCEKALGVTSTETANIIHYAKSPVSCVFNYWFYDAMQKMKQIIDAGDLGHLTHFRIEMPQAGYLMSNPQGWRMSDDGIYLDLMTHLLHLIWAVTSEYPKSVTAQERKYSNLGIVDYVSAFVECETFTADLFVSKCSAGNTNGLRLRVYGTKGSAEWHQRNPDVLVLGGVEHPGAVISMEVPNKLFKLGHPSAGFVGALANLYEAWANDPSCPWLSPLVAHNGLLAVEAMRESARTERTVMLW